MKPISQRELESFLARLVRAPLPDDDAERIDQLRLIEQIKCAGEARQARVTRDFDASQRAAAAQAGVKAERQGRGIGHQVALARRVSPNRGARLLGLAKVLGEMPYLEAAFDAGLVTEWRVAQLLRETACLSLEHRQEVDRLLCSDPARLETTGDRRLLGQARALAARLDPGAVAAARAKAEQDRRVTLRPAPDTMTYLTALLPAKDGVAAYAGLKADAGAAVASGKATSIDQAMADLLVQRATGREPGEPQPVALNLVMTESALFEGSDDTAHLEELGEIPADLARALVDEALGGAEKTWIRRLYTSPETGELVSMDSRQRAFPKALAKFIRLRDRHCRNPWCDAPIRHIDHITPYAEGGATSAGNGQGYCEACNHAKQAPGWRHERIPDRPGHVVAITTPTGHTYESHAPPLVDRARSPLPLDIMWLTWSTARAA